MTKHDDRAEGHADVTESETPPRDNRDGNTMIKQGDTMTKQGGTMTKQGDTYDA